MSPPTSLFQIEGFNSWRSFARDPYHLFTFMPWWIFLSAISLIYGLTNILFATAYSLDLNGIANATGWIDAFFFSVQTLGSIGYGAMYPQSVYIHSVVTVEAFAGLLEIALLTGLVFTRFSRSHARIIFSKVMVVCPYNGVNCLMFRIANQRQNLILEAKLSAYLLINEISEEGQELRRFYDLELVRNTTPNLVLSWLAMHSIDAQSPLYNLSPQQLRERMANILVTVVGLDQTVMQEIHTRHTYRIEDICWQSRFADIFQRLPNHKVRINYQLFHSIESLE